MRRIEYVKKVIGVWIFITLSICGYAQMMPMKDKDTFMKRLEESSRSVKSIESRFEQVKHLDIFNDDVVSKGSFHYLAPDKIAMLYTSPVKYSMVINGDLLKTESNGKSSIVS